MRLIDGDELLKPVGGYERVKYTYEYGDVVTVEDIELMPTIDAEPVVRCCDCKYLQCNMRQDGNLPFGVDEYECRHWCGSCDPTDFCSYGERREE